MITSFKKSHFKLFSNIFLIPGTTRIRLTLFIPTHSSTKDQVTPMKTRLSNSTLQSLSLPISKTLLVVKKKMTFQKIWITQFQVRRIQLDVQMVFALSFNALFPSIGRKTKITNLFWRRNSIQSLSKVLNTLSFQSTLWLQFRRKQNRMQ